MVSHDDERDRRSLPDFRPEVPGRAGPDQITLADLCGLGVEDAAMADLVMASLG